MQVELDGASLGVAAGAMLTALGWALVQRIRTAKRIMPRGKIELYISMETPVSGKPSDPRGTVSIEPEPFPEQQQQRESKPDGSRKPE